MPCSHRFWRHSDKNEGKKGPFYNVTMARMYKGARWHLEEVRVACAGIFRCNTAHRIHHVTPGSCPLHPIPTCQHIQNIVWFHMSAVKPVEFIGSSLDDLRTFPLLARREAGHQIDQVQNGQEPDDWKPMSVVGHGVKEIRIRDPAGAFRVIYVAKFAEAVYVLHCFQKKTEKTSRTDVDLASKRYRQLLQERGQ